MRSGYIFPVTLIAGFLLFTLAGCGGTGTPIAPGSPGPAVSGAVDPQSRSGEFCWGLYDIAVDPLSESVEIVPIRGATFEANVTKFLQPPLAPIDLLTISIEPGTDFATGYVVLDVRIKHPFPATNLRGFDVMGVFMPAEGGYTSSWDPALAWPSESQARLLNPDGYTRWWNQVEFTTYNTIFGYTEGNKAVHPFMSTCTLNPFKYFADGLEAEDPFDLEHLSMTDRGSFDTVDPGVNIRRYIIQFPSNGPKPDYRFKYAITSSYWGPNGQYPPPAPTEDFPLTANRAEAVQISVSDDGSWAYYEDESTYGGDLVFDLQITDWQGIGSMDGPVSQIGGVYAESPTLFDGVVNLMDTGLIAYEPMNPSMTLAQCTIANVTPDDVFGQYLLIIVTSASPTDYSVQLPDVTGFDYPESAILAAFTVWEAQISPFAPQQNLPPVADASMTNPVEGYPPLQVNLDPSLSFDPDGFIVSYEWDIENDGSYEYSIVTPDIVPHVFNDPGTYEVQLRVTDDDGASDNLDTPLIINVLADDPCAKGPNLLCTGDGNIFVDGYVEQADNTQLFRNIINFDLGGPNSQNTIVKYYTGHGGTHNNSPINDKIKGIVEGEGFTLVDTNEEPIDTTGCRIIFICLPGQNPAAFFSQEEFDTLKAFLVDGGRIVLTQEYNDSGLQIQWGNDILDALGSTIERLDTSTTNQLFSIPNECYAITDGVSQTFNPAYTSFQPGAGDMSFIDDQDGLHVLVADWL